MCTFPYFGTSSIQKPIYFKYQIYRGRDPRRRMPGHAPGNEHGASSPSILPTILPIFTYDYKEKNGRREARGKSLFINAEYIQASVSTCLIRNGEL